MLGSTQVEDTFKLESKLTSSQLSVSSLSSHSASDVSDDEVNRLPTKIAKRVKSFQPRTSQLDREAIENNDFKPRGVFTFFWIAMSFYLMNTGIQNFQTIGQFVGLSFYKLFTKDFLVLMISDAFMVGSMFFVVILQKLISIGWIRWRYTGMIIQHVFQTIFLFVPIYWSFFRGWPWVQSGFFLLHTISMLMKLHSYSFYNVHQLKEVISQVEGYLKSPLGNTQYPNNITVSNFIDFLLVPTLVYELEYPRTKEIRPWYVFEKLLATFGTFFLLYVNTQSYIIPVLPNASSTSVWEMIVKISFADRNFYDDWWNSVTFEEFARKWNKPVHHFLLRHVYQQSIESYKLSKRDATFMTFFLSSLIHELVMVVVAKKIRMYLFFFQMLQLPLIWLGNLKFVKERKWLGNAFFWFGMFVGPPLLGVLYCREAFFE
ncbi:10306_t:CDS:2 [Entrophospora sp. SA101]|nr:10306_t:CDS:2 [Entrophospora sp. SA101]